MIHYLSLPRFASLAALIVAFVAPAASVAQTVSFSAASDFAVMGPNPYSVAIADLNGDGTPDLAVTGNSNHVSILLGNGDGSFEPATNFSVGAVNPNTVAIGDLNADGKPDLATANYSSNNVSVLLGDGTGSFGSATTFGAGVNPFSVAIGDFNGDGKSDLAVANHFGHNVSILLGAGTGSFGSATNFAAGTGPDSIVIGDFNGDLKLDVAVSNFYSDNVSILFGTGTGSFGSTTNVGVGDGPRSVAIGDFNTDLQPDLAVSNDLGNNVSILLGTGTGSFAPAMNVGEGDSYFLAIGDLNGDGKPDLAVANFSSDDVSILIGTGSGSFEAATNFGAGDGPSSVAIEDLNGDGKPDLAVTNLYDYTVSILLNTTVPAPPGPAVLTLNPTADTNPVGTQHCVTATARDASGDPTPDITVRFGVTGAITTGGTAVTDGEGQATFCYWGPTTPGADAITAYADTDDNGAQDPGEPGGAATKTWIAGAPATLTLSPATSINPINTELCVTATVMDAFGNLSPDVTVRFAVIGSVVTGGSAVTNASGESLFCYTGPPVPGVDAISAFADTNENASQNAGEPSGAAATTWFVPLPTAVEQCKDGGWITFGVFKNQGDCVAFLSTGGKNPPFNLP